jgi:hypothetical protein
LEQEAAAPSAAAPIQPIVVEQIETASRRESRETTVVPVEMAPARSPSPGAQVVESDAPLDGTHGAGALAQDQRAHTPAASPLSLDGGLAEPPIVHVTIGRIEVRAMMDAPVPARAVPAPISAAAPRLSLDQYLRERSEGRR